MGASNKPRGDVRTLIQAHGRSDPDVLEVFLRGEGEPFSLVIWVKIIGRKCKAVVDSGALVTVIKKDCFKGCMRGKQSRPAQFKGVAEDNSLMAEVVDDVEIEILWQIFLMNVS